jgi:hypothetical protein
MGRRSGWALLFVPLALATSSCASIEGLDSYGAGPGESSKGVGPDATGEHATEETGDAGILTDSGSGFAFVSDSGGSVGTLSIVPPTAVISVTVDAMGVHTAPLTFTAQSGATSVAPLWSLDRGDLGTIGVGDGTFTASGQGAGIGTITATAGSLSGSAAITIQVHMVEDGASSGDGGAAEAGLGGSGGVGGSPLGASVQTGVMTQLRAVANADAGLSAGTFAWLYPYDQTVWPQGVLAPLLQWAAPPTPASAVYLHLTQANFEFEGFYSGANLVNQPINATAWTEATNGNGGDPLRVEVTVTDGTHVYGPIAENWHVAPGQLKGVVYYSSYYTKLANPVYEGQPAAILAIRSGSTSPDLAIPGSESKCLVCHELSGDGAALFASNGQAYPDYNETDAFDLRVASGTATQTYTGNSPDGTVNNRKFLWSGIWQDGSFALQGSGLAQETYAWSTPGADTDSRIFRRTDGNAVPAPGFDGQIKQAVTPAFSPDGTMVAFNFLAAQPGADAGLPGNGHTLDLMDFACGMPVDAGGAPSPSGGPSCRTFQFSGLRRLYSNASLSGYPAWPAWLPDSNGIVFHNTVAPGSESPISTWGGAEAELWFVNVPDATNATAQAVPAYALNGKLPNGASYLPTNAMHPDDTVLNYEPTASPIASGGYFWVVFTSRRMYGNVATGDPYDVGNGSYPVAKKLWVAAIDLHPIPGQDPSHPAFYLPGQELNAPNMRGFWVPAPCASDGMSCSTGDECCGGFCQSMSGTLACSSTKPSCAQEYEKCTQTSDCCGAAQGYTCINSVCSAPAQTIQ